MKDKTIYMNFKLPTRLKEALTMKAKRNGLFRSSYLRMQIAESCREEYESLADKYSE